MKKANNLKRNKWIEIPGVINRIPGALVYRGSKLEAFQIEVYSYNALEYKKETFDSVRAFVESDIQKEALVKRQWINITGVNHVEEIKQLESLFQIPKPILEQIVESSTHSTYTVMPNLLYSDIQMVYYRNEVFMAENIGLLMNNNCVITFQERKGDVFDGIRNRIENNLGSIRTRNLGYTYFCFLDALVNNYMEVLGQVEQLIEYMEELVIDLEPLEVKKIHLVRKQLMILKFSTKPLDKMIETCLKDNLLGKDNRNYVDSLAHHINEVQSILGIQKEMIDSLYENFLLNNSNDMNNIMTTLTVFSAVFIPLSFLAGVFGMNFEHMPGLNVAGGFYYFIGGCVLSTVVMISFFKLKKWF